MKRALAGGLAAAGVALLIEALALRPAPEYFPTELFASQVLFVTVVCVLLSLLLAGRRQDRAWAAALFAAPVLLVALPSGFAAVGAVALPIVSLGAIGAVAAWAWLPLGHGAPLVAVAAGTFLAGRLAGLSGAALQEPAELATAAAFAVGALVVAIAAGRLPSQARVPAAGVCLGIAAAAGASAALLVPLGSARPIPPPPKSATANAERPSVVLIVLDTVRADRLGLYGAERDPMPRVSRFVREEEMEVLESVSSGAWTLPSHASLFTGLDPPRHGAHAPFLDEQIDLQGYPLREDVPTLASIFQSEGYWTVAIAANHGPLDPVFRLDRGFDVYRAEPSPLEDIKTRIGWRASGQPWLPLSLLDHIPLFGSCDFFGPSVPYRRADEITDTVLSALERSEGRPMFLFVNYMEAHAPYHPPVHAPKLPGASSTRSGLRPVHDQAEVRAVMKGEREVQPEERRTLLSLYDRELAYLDVHLHRLLEGLRSDPRWSDTLVVVTSDHGEGLGEHGLLWHGTSLYREQIRVPFLAKLGPTTPRPGPEPPVVQSVDVLPLALAHAGAERPASVDGSVWAGERSAAVSWRYPSSRWRDVDRIQSEDVALQRRDDWKLIQRMPKGEVELYDLAADPRETRDLAGRRSELARTLREELPDPERYRPEVEDVVDPELRDRLRALGYGR